MATSKIKGTGGFTDGVITCSIAGATPVTNRCWRDGNVVNIGFRVDNIDIAEGIVGYVPVGFRPAVRTASGIGICYINNVTTPMVVAVNTDGSIHIGARSEKHITHIDIGMSYGTH